MKRTGLRSALFLAGLAALGWLAWTARAGLAQLPGQLDFSRFGLALLAGLVFLAAQGLLFALLLRKNGVGTELSTLVAIFFWSQPAKYLPGRIWSPALQAAELGRTEAIGATVVANIELALLGTLQTLALGCALLPGLSMPQRALILLCAAGLAVVLLRQQALAGLVHRWRTRLRWLPAVTVAHQTAPTGWAAALALSAGCLLLNFATSLSVVLTHAGLDLHLALPLLCALYLGWTAGYFALPVPAGLGVREASTVVFAHWIAPAAPLDLVVAVTLIARVWQIAVDVLAVGVAALWKLRRRS